MLSRFIFYASAAMLVAGATSAIASPTDSSATPSTVFSDSAKENVAVPSVTESVPVVGSVLSGDPAVPKLPAVGPDSTGGSAVSKVPAVGPVLSGDTAVPNPAAVGPVLSDAPAVAPSALERDRLNSVIFAAPGGLSIATTGGADFRLPSTLRGDSPRSFEDDWRYRVNPRDELYGPVSTRRQETIDRIGDMISPGFGRFEFDSGRNHIRIDYLYSRKCKLRGAGVCFRMTF